MGEDSAPLFDEETRTQLPQLLAHLPEPVHINVWGEETASKAEREAAVLCHALADQFDTISFQMLPRRVNYEYYPVLGIMGGTLNDWHDFGVRIIGLPNGYQMTSLITAVQAVSFRGMTSEAVTRIKLSNLDADVAIEVITAADNEAGALMAHPLFNMAVFTPHIRTFLIMGDQFPAAMTRYSITTLPHTVINGRIHIEGVVDEATILAHMGTAVQSRQDDSD